MTSSGTPTQCRALVAGFGRPGMRDLDFGRQLVDFLQQMEWPDGVVVEDLSCAVPLVLHRLQELRPAKVVLVGAVARGLDAPASLRRYQVTTTPPSPIDVHRGLEESVNGLIDLDHTLAVARHWGGLPVDTVVIEVEPAEASFGLGFSEELAACIDPILDLVREELAGIVGRAARPPDLDVRELTPAPPDRRPTATVRSQDPNSPSPAMTELLGYAKDHAQARLQSHRAPALVEQMSSDVPGVTLAGKVRPWGVFVESGGDWFDALPLADGRLGVVVGNVDGRGVEVAAAMSDLRAAVRAYAVMDGVSPARLLGQLDRLADTTGLGRGARVLYLVVDPATGDVVFTNAGGCPPLVLESGGSAGHYLYAGRSAQIGASSATDRPQATLRLTHGATVLLFTDGLVESRTVPRAAGLERLRRAVAGGPGELDELCEHVLGACTADMRRDDDICLLGLRLGPGGAVRQAATGTSVGNPRQAETAARGSAASLSTKPRW
ncbi:MAG: PP2C family protein-serine/threonine phosphatase [Acidimicrobiales bacterium]